MHLEEIGLFNVFRERFQTSNLPRIHARGANAIDHIWTTRHILDNISHAGFAPFGFRIESDQRGMFIDIRDSVLFDEKGIHVTYHDFRKLKPTIPKRTKKYMQSVKYNWDYHRIDDKFEKLLHLESTSSPTDIENEINALDKQITEILVGAEKRCTKLCSHYLQDWSSGMLKALKLHRHCKTKLTQASKLSLDSCLVDSIENFQQALQNYKEADNTYIELDKNSDEIRKSFQEELAKDISAQKGTEAAKETKCLRQIEKQRNQAQRLHNTLKPKGGVPTVYSSQL